LKSRKIEREKSYYLRPLLQIKRNLIPNFSG